MAKRYLEEAVEEVEKYGSFSSMYLIVKKLRDEFDRLSKEEFREYDFKIDDLVLLSLKGEMCKVKLLVSSFLVHDYLSRKYVVQDGLFYFRWSKRIFVYSPRVESHLLYLVRLGYLEGGKKFKLSKKGKTEADSIMSILGREEVKDITSLVENVIRAKKLKDLKRYVKEYLFATV